MPGGVKIEPDRVCPNSLTQQHNNNINDCMQLYFLTAGDASMEVLWRHHNDSIAEHFDAKQTLEIVARNYY